MIDIKEKKQCCGCEACATICPKNCIEMQEDEEGFRYPIIDKKKCIQCGACERVCPWLKEPNKETLKEVEFFAAYNKNDDELKKSSSGGIFSLLAKEILKNEGTIYGVIQESTYEVVYSKAQNLEEFEKMRGSKYLQAKINGIYKQVKEDLQNNKTVLFSGTPCQVAALYRFLDKDYEKLYTVDVVCHGVPSNKVYRKFIQKIEEKKKQKVTNIKWRDKVKGWGPNRVTIFFENGDKQTTTSKENPFQNGFLNNLYLRNSCYNCKYAKLPRIGDISLADFWGYKGELEFENQNKGISAVIISSEKGKQLFKKTETQINYHTVEKEYVIQRSRHTYTHPIENKKRQSFFLELDKMGFEKICKKYEMTNSRLKDMAKQLKRQIKNIIKGKKK